MNEYSPLTRLLHWGLAAGIAMQLLLSTFMEQPRPGAVRGAAEALGFTLHETVGVILLPLLLIWFAWVVLRRGEPSLWALFPWRRAVSRQQLFQASRTAWSQALQHRLADAAVIEPLVRSVHGLGALCALFMAGSGTLLRWGMGSDGTLTGWAALLLDLHQAAANLMWVYLLGHAGMALLHQWRGERILQRMFSLSRR